MSAWRVAIAGGCAVVALAAHAQTQGTAGSDAASGASIANQGAGGPPCASCHGARGEGNTQGGFPRLAAQPEAYLERQLELYANGGRQNAVMTPIAQALKPDQRRMVAQHYAMVDAPAAVKASAPKGGSVAQLVSVGDARRGIQGCVNCHGPQGRGEPPGFPALAAQVPAYLATSLGQWKSGARKTDPSGQMNHVAASLSEPEIAALAQYFAALPAPTPLRAVMPPEAAASAARPSGPTTAEPKQAVGVEQGGPTTGGSQGQGAGGTATGAAQPGSSGAGSNAQPPATTPPGGTR